MKHILNNLTEEEKNAIREQHSGGMKVMTENFSKLINSKLGDSKPLVNEQSSLGAVGNGLEINGQLGNVILQTLPTTSLFNMIKSAASGDAKSFNQVLDQEKSRLGQHYQTLKNAVTGGDISKTLSNIATSLTGIAAPFIKQMQSGMGNKPQSSGGSWGDVAKGALLGVAGLNEQQLPYQPSLKSVIDEPIANALPSIKNKMNSAIAKPIANAMPAIKACIAKGGYPKISEFMKREETKQLDNIVVDLLVTFGIKKDPAAAEELRRLVECLNQSGMKM